MRRLLALGLAALAAAGIALGLSHTGGGRPPYEVRAVFDDAFGVTPGEDVRVAGVRVGQVVALHTTPEHRAAVVLLIDDPAFRDFREDATCTIQTQSLIGEKFVECAPTRPKRAGESQSAPLPIVGAGRPGAGERLLSVQHTSSPVSIDMLADTLRLPVRERLRLILNEFGAGLAGRGEDLNAAIRRADPALEQTDRVLAILAGEHRTLAALVTDSDRVLAPLARDRAAVAGFIAHAAGVAEATAARRGDLQRVIERLPPFLRQLRPTMRELDRAAAQLTPALADLRAAAPAANALVQATGPLARQARPALVALGAAARPGATTLRDALPILRELRPFARSGRPLAANLAALLDSFEATGGISDLLAYGLAQVGNFNGYDAFGHYTRGLLVAGPCDMYATQPVAGCSAQFTGPVAARAQRQRRTALIRREQPRARARDSAPPRELRSRPAATVARATHGAPARGSTGARPLLDYLLGAGS